MNAIIKSVTVPAGVSNLMPAWTRGILTLGTVICSVLCSSCGLEP
jgi:hypothetical protein